MSTPKPLTNSQRRAATLLLEEEEARLWNEYSQQFVQRPRHSTNAKTARDEWLAANPDYVEILARAEKYAKRVRKRFDEFADEVKALFPNARVADAYVSAHLSVHMLKPHPHYRNDQEQTPWVERERELNEADEVKRLAVHKAIQDRIAKGKRDILLATVGDALESLYTLPSLAEIEASI